VAVPRPTLDRRRDPFDDDDDAFDDDDDDDDDDALDVNTPVVTEPMDWRLTAATFAVIWAGFTSMVVFIATPGPGSLAAWFVATGAMGLETWRQRRTFRRWKRQQRRRLGRTTSSAGREGVENRLTTGDVLRIEPALDEDAAGLDGAGAGAGEGVVAQVKLGLADGAARQGQVRAGPDDGGGDDV